MVSSSSADASRVMPDLLAGSQAPPANKIALRSLLCAAFPTVPQECADTASASSVSQQTGKASTTPSVPMIDVRSPGEYLRGHIPGALSLPLFDDDERAQVGTCFKHNGRFAAIQLGLSFVGPKLGTMVQRVQALAGVQPGDVIFVYCWRGGMRSSSVCWLLGLCGFRASALAGGYRAFRRWVQSLLHSAPASSSPALSSCSQEASHGVSIGDTNEDDDDDDDDDDGASGSSKAKAAAATAAAIAASFATVESSDAVHLGGSARAASTCATSSASALPSNFAAAFAIAPDDAAAAAAAATAAAAPPTSSAASGALFARAKAAKEAGNMHEAIELYGQAFAAGHPRGDQCLLMAATCYAKLGGHSEALALYDASLQRLPQRLAWQQRQQQDGDGIGKGGGGGGGRGGEAQAILRLQDLRAESLEALGRLEDAMAAMRLASAIEPSSRRAKELGRLQALSVDATASAATANGAEVGTSDAAYGGRSSGASGVAMAALARERQWRPAPLPHEPPLASLRVLGGRTGSGKTLLLHALADLGEQVLDLEGLAEHMGSAFGRVGQTRPQPSNEMFENLVGLRWRQADPSRPLWVEHEGRHVGSCLVPLRMFEQLRAPELLVMLSVPRAARVRHLVRIYSHIGIDASQNVSDSDGKGGGAGGGTAAAGVAGGGGIAGGGDGVQREGDGRVRSDVVAELISSVESLRKRRGGAATTAALEQLAKGDFAGVADAALEYYDGLYDAYAESSRRQHVLEVECAEAGQASDARRVLDLVGAEEASRRRADAVEGSAQ